MLFLIDKKIEETCNFQEKKKLEQMITKHH